MLLEALVTCAGVTLKAVAVALEIDVREGQVTAEGDLDFRGTLGVDRTAPVGFVEIRMKFKIDANVEREKMEKLVQLTERYCVVLQTIKGATAVISSVESGKEAQVESSVAS